MEALLGEGKWSNPLAIDVSFDSQLEAMIRRNPKAYAKRPELPSMLERVRAELATPLAWPTAVLRDSKSCRRSSIHCVDAPLRKFRMERRAPPTGDGRARTIIGAS